MATKPDIQSLPYNGIKPVGILRWIIPPKNTTPIGTSTKPADISEESSRRRRYAKRPILERK